MKIKLCISALILIANLLFNSAALSNKPLCCGYPKSQIIGNWASGIWYYDVPAKSWTKMSAELINGQLTTGDFNGDGKAEVVAIRNNKLQYLTSYPFNWVTINSSRPEHMATGDMNFDGIDEIFGSWSSGVWYWDLANSRWTQPTKDGAVDGITTGDYNGDGYTDTVFIWDKGLWMLDGKSSQRKRISSAPSDITTGDISADGRPDLIGVWSSGIWFYDLYQSKWTKLTSGVPSGNISAGDFNGDGWDDVVSIWKSGVWIQDGFSLQWTKITSSKPQSITTGNLYGNPR